jgi:CubicO group peptidase (beta-lactamase class C family)
MPGHDDREQDGGRSGSDRSSGLMPGRLAEIARRVYEGRLLPSEQVITFRQTERLFATRPVLRGGGPVQTLPRRATQIQDVAIRSGGKHYDLYDYLSRNRIAGALLLKGGEIAFEYYDFGNDPTTRWMSMSMAKSVSTTLIGAAVQQGLIGDVDEQLTVYLPELKSSAYDGVTIRQLLQMSSGVAWDDTHTEPASERRAMLELQIEQQPGAILRYMRQLKRVAAPGTAWNYNTGDTHVVGALLHAATGRWAADYLSERIWSRLGMEADASWWLESPDGLEVAGSGISATLRDYGRFGRFLLQDGVAGGERILPENWIREAVAPRNIGGKQVEYGYMWWPVAAPDGTFGNGAFSARGIFGQYIYINPAEQVVVVILSSRSKPKGAEAIPDNDFFNAAVETLKSP